MRPLDLIRNAVQGRREQAELRHLHDGFRQHAESAEEKRDDLCAAVVAHALDLSPDDAVPPVARAAWQLCQALLAYEGHLHVPDIDLSRARGTAETWELKAELARALRPFEEPQTAELIGNALAFVVKNLSDGVPAAADADAETAALSVPLYALMREPAAAIEAAIGAAFDDDIERAGLFPRLRARLGRNLCTASGIDPDRAEESRKAVVMPSKADREPAELVAGYLAGTPLAGFLETPLPFSISFRARFEHTHIVGGSGHGKTQLLQQLILRDLDQLRAGRGSLIVIDSQGDMLRTITRLAELSPAHAESLFDRLVLIARGQKPRASYGKWAKPLTEGHGKTQCFRHFSVSLRPRSGDAAPACPGFLTRCSDVAVDSLAHLDRRWA